MADLPISLSVDDIEGLPYRATFAATVRVIEPTDDTFKEAKASLNDLKRLIPSDIDPQAENDLLLIAANLMVGGVINLNDDGMTIEKTLSVYKKFERKQCNIEHNRGQIVGYIVKAGLTEFGTNRIITEDEARIAGKPFNVATVTVLWKVANKELCNFIIANSVPGNDIDKDALSLSFEVGFDKYDIACIGKSSSLIGDAPKVVTEDDGAIFLEYDAALRINGGSGTKGQRKVARILTGNVVPLGQGIVAHPAAKVKGIVPIMEKPAVAESIEPPPMVNPGAPTEILQANPPDTPIDLTLIPTSANFDKINQSHTNPMKIKIPDALLSKTAHLPNDSETETLASITLSNDQVVTDVKIKGNDYLIVTYKVDIDGVDIKDITIPVATQAVSEQKTNLELVSLIDDVKGLTAKLNQLVKYLGINKAEDKSQNVSVEEQKIVASEAHK